VSKEMEDIIEADFWPVGMRMDLINEIAVLFVHYVLGSVQNFLL